MKKPIDRGGFGNQKTIKAAASENPKRGQKAMTQGRRGLSPLDHLATNQPARIWKGKSIKTARPRSSRFNPFSTILSDVTASLAANPIFANRCIKISNWMSVKQSSVWHKQRIPKTITFQLADSPYCLVDILDAHFCLPYGFFVLKLRQVSHTKGERV